MTEIITRNTKSAELTYGEGDNQIAAPSRTTAINLTLDENHNREVVVFNGASITATLTTAATLEAALNTTGGGDIVGYIVTLVNINATALTITSATNVDGEAGDLTLSQYNSISIAYDPTSNTYVTVSGAKSAFANNSNGEPTVNSTVLDVVTDVTTATWESVGASGATNTWAAMADVPLGVDWIEVRISSLCTAVSSADVDATISARATGSAATGNNTILVATLTTTAAATTLLQQIASFKIPVDTSGHFDLMWTQAANNTAEFDLYLVGYGWNK